MARQNGQATWITPASAVAGQEGDLLSSTSTRRIFTATERMTVTEVGCIITAAAGSAAPINPGTAFTFTANVRTCGTPANDMVIPVFTAAFAAEGGVGGDPSTLNFNNANQIPNGVITNTLGSFTSSGAANTGCVIRAYCEQSLNKGDQLVFKVAAAGTTNSLGIFYATAWYDGKGIVEANEVDSN